MIGEYLVFSSALKADETNAYFRRCQSRRNKLRLFSSTQNMCLFSSACVADENNRIFIGC
jgi:hypothetical protein